MPGWRAVGGDWDRVPIVDHDGAVEAAESGRQQCGGGAGWYQNVAGWSPGTEYS